MHKFSSILFGLTEVVSKHANRVTDSESESSELPRHDPSLDTAANTPDASQAVTSKKARASQKRSPDTCPQPSAIAGDASSTRCDRTGTKRTASADPGTASKRNAGNSVQLASHSGRYAKREHNKMVKGYSAADLAAILGQPAPGAPP
jgi:hypothetical protein